MTGKKLLAIFISTCMMVSLLAGCGNDGGGSGDSGKIKIGVSIWSSTDVLGAQCKKILDKAAEVLGDVELTYIDQGHVSEKVTASVETLIDDGCQGLIICNSSDREMPPIIDSCNDNKVYAAQFFRIISEEDSADIYDKARESDYFIGAVHENEVENGNRLAQILLDKGCRNIGLMGWEQGDATWLRRWEGYKSGVDQWNSSHIDDPVILFGPQYAGTTEEGGIKAAEQMMSENPNMDALVPAGGGGEPLKGAVEAVIKAGKKDTIKIVSTDFLPNLGELLKDGPVAGESGGHYCDPLFALMMVYQAVKGDLSGIRGSFVDMEFPYLYISSSEDYQTYEKYFVDRLPYSDDEIREMASMNTTGLQTKAAAMSIEDAKARLG